MNPFESYVVAYLRKLDFQLQCVISIIQSDDRETKRLNSLMIQSERELAAVVATAGGHIPPATKDTTMNPTLQKLSDSVTAMTTVAASATTLINGIAQRIQDAVTAAIANGATADQLKPVSDEADALTASATALSAAIAANTTPASMPPTPTP